MRDFSYKFIENHVFNPCVRLFTGKWLENSTTSVVDNYRLRGWAWGRRTGVAKIMKHNTITAWGRGMMSLCCSAHFMLREAHAFSDSIIIKHWVERTHALHSCSFIATVSTRSFNFIFVETLYFE